jgi:predicted MFS family arabinose efflux permease
MTDRLPARAVYLASIAVSALASLGVALSDGLLPALAWRTVAGIALAGTYMPGLRALTDGVEGARRARIAAWYASSFTIGTSLSFLLGRVGVLWDWRSAFILAAIMGAAGALIAWAALPRSGIAAGERQRPMPGVRAVLRNRGAVTLIIGYAAAIWGASGLRQWIVVFLAFCAGDDAAAQGWSMLAVGALIGFLGVPAGLLGNELSLRFGLRVTALCVFLLSALANCLFGSVALLPYGAAVWLSLVAGFIAQGNYANLTSAVLAAAAPRHARATMALYSCVGFGGGFVGTLLFGVALDHFGGAARRGARLGYRPSPPAESPAWRAPPPSPCRT